MTARKTTRKKTTKKKATRKTAARSPRKPRSPRAPRARKKTPAGAKDPGGRPAIDWTGEVVETVATMAEAGNTVEDIARILRVGKSTLEEAIANVEAVRQAYYEGGAKLNDKLRRAQVTGAVDDRNPTLLKWLGIQRLGQRDVKAVEVSGTGEGGAIPVEADLAPVVVRKIGELLRSRGKR